MHTGRSFTHRSNYSVLAIIALATLLFIPTADAQISLGTAQSFAVLGGSTVTNTGVSQISGSVGVSPGTATTGFGTAVITNGTIQTGPASTAGQAQNDLTTAYNAAAATPCTTTLTGQDLGTVGTLTPGVYCFTSSAQLTGNLTLNLQGNPNALFIFKIATTLTTASASQVLLLNSGGTTCPPNIFFQVGSSATLGTGTRFVGNILAQDAITITTGATLNGRALARTAAVTLDTNSIAACGAIVACPIITVNPATLPNGVLGNAYNTTVSATGGSGTYSFGLTSGALPTGLILNMGTGAITGSPTTAGTFNFTITATDSASGCFGSRAYTIVIAGACPVITVNPATLPDGAVANPYAATVTATGGSGSYTFGLAAGALPTGLTLNTTGAITGTPSVAGTFNYTIRATDTATGCQGTRAYTTIITGVILPPVAGVPTLDFLGLAILSVLLVLAGLFVMNRLSL